MKIKSFMNVLNIGKYLAMAALVMGTMTACSSDDDDNDGGGASSFETPKYEADAAKYVMDETQAPYASIELTASGNYVITPSQYTNAKKHATNGTRSETGKKGIAMLMQNILKSNAANAMTRSSDDYIYSHIAYGKYTKTGENEYTLEGFGTITITKDENGNAYSIVIKRNGGSAEEYTAKKQNPDLNSAKSNMLCRTWSIAGYRYYAKLNGKTIVDFKDNTLKGLATQMYNWLKKNDPEFEEGDFDVNDIINSTPEPENVVFTKTGTYVVYYSEDRLAVSTWKWENENKGILRYSWNPDYLNDPDESGEVLIEFKNNRLYLTESDSDYDEEDGETYEEGLTYIMTEVK